LPGGPAESEPAPRSNRTDLDENVGSPPDQEIEGSILLASQHHNLLSSSKSEAQHLMVERVRAYWTHESPGVAAGASM
jgi:hypothetical protein